MSDNNIYQDDLFKNISGDPISSTPLHKNTVNLVGNRIGKLLIIGWTHKNGRSGLSWVCKCDCGKIHITRFNRELRNPKSCGCGKSEFISVSRTSHGKSTSRIYHIWRGMIYRCHKQTKGKDVKHYRDRGITVCERWRGSKGFDNFLVDMGDPGDDSTLTIDRRNNSLGYTPSNCYWATQVEQHRNKRNNTLLTKDGVTQPLSAWAEQTGIKRFTIMARIKHGWSIEDSLTTPVR